MEYGEKRWEMGEELDAGTNKSVHFVSKLLYRGGRGNKMVNWIEVVGLEGVNPHKQRQLVGGGILIFALMSITV